MRVCARAGWRITIPESVKEHMGLKMGEIVRLRVVRKNPDE